MSGSGEEEKLWKYLATAVRNDKMTVVLLTKVRPGLF